MGIRRIYVASQLIGWFSYFLLAFLLNQLADVPIDINLFFSLGTAFFLGLILSHAYREIILRYDWLKLSIVKIIPRFIFGSILFGILFEIWYVILTNILPNGFASLQLSIIMQELAGWFILFLLWSLIYFFYHFFKNYKAEEIKNLKWEARINEIELNKLKSQLNPHFMFNSMNTIRALIDENPKMAKLAVTQLSNILRSNLLMGRQKLIPLEKEIKLVKDYLAVESYRYEERLTYSLDVDPNSLGTLIPPLMIQTLVENGIKHGISKIPKGGELTVRTSLKEEYLLVEIVNSGQYDPDDTSETGFGLVNTQERLKILFGKGGKFHIENKNQNQVRTSIEIPIQDSYED